LTPYEKIANNNSSKMYCKNSKLKILYYVQE